MKTVAVIQARMGSTRLPGKSTMDIVGIPMLGHVIRRAKQSNVDHVIVAIPHEPASLELINIVAQYEVAGLVHPGDPNDVIGRYAAATRLSGADWIVRIPGDNPCVMPTQINRILDFATLGGRVDVLHSNLDANIQQNGYPGGIGAEVYHKDFISFLDATVSFPLLREHPHLWAYANKKVETFNFGRHEGGLRFDVNTQDDLDYVRDLYSVIGTLDFDSDALIAAARRSK